jgi:CPA1 family monovalent cation:H+ antiporter
MSAFEILATILVIVAIGGYVNYRYFKMPASIGHMVFALGVSVASVILGQTGILDIPAQIVDTIDFSSLMLHGLLGFLLFAGALHIRVDDLRDVKSAVAVLASLGVVIATLVTGTLVWFLAGLVGLDVPFDAAILFGALISPTDPIAVLAILKEAGASKRLYAKIGGESLFNDGIAVVVFLTILGAMNNTGPQTPLTVLVTLVREALGGGLLGFGLGWLAYRLLASVNDYKVEVMITLALVAGGYALAEHIHVSAPICMVVAGLVIGHHGRIWGMSEVTRHHLYIFWELLDEILNAVLFMLVGLQILLVTITAGHLVLGFLAILAVLLGRYISVGLPISIMRLRSSFEHGTVRLLTWGGLRGGISVALALSLPPGPEKAIILPVTYIVVLFSILVQGLTFRRLVERLQKTET